MKEPSIWVSEKEWKQPSFYGVTVGDRFSLRRFTD